MRNYLITCAALACAIVLMPATKSFAQPAAKPLPEGLNHVPVDAMGFIHIRISDFPKSEVGAALLTEIQREGKKGFNDLEKMFGISVSEIESVTFLILAPNMRAIMMGPGDWRRYPPLDGMRFPKSDFDRWTLISDPVDDFGGPPNPLAIITAKKPLDQKKILIERLLCGDDRQRVRWSAEIVNRIGNQCPAIKITFGEPHPVKRGVSAPISRAHHYGAHVWRQYEKRHAFNFGHGDTEHLL